MARVVGVSNSPSFEDAAVMKLYQPSTRNVLAQEAATGVKQLAGIPFDGKKVRLSDTPSKASCV